MRSSRQSPSNVIRRHPPPAPAMRPALLVDGAYSEYAGPDGCPNFMVGSSPMGIDTCVKAGRRLSQHGRCPRDQHRRRIQEAAKDGSTASPRPSGPRRERHRSTAHLPRPADRSSLLRITAKSLNLLVIDVDDERLQPVRPGSMMPIQTGLVSPAPQDQVGKNSSDPPVPTKRMVFSPL